MKSKYSIASQPKPRRYSDWTAVYTSPCSGRVKSSFMAPSLDRADFTGFWSYIKHDTPFKPGIYSAPGTWTDIFGMGSAAHVTTTYEWTYTDDSSSLRWPGRSPGRAGARGCG